MNLGYCYYVQRQRSENNISNVITHVYYNVFYNVGDVLNDKIFL